MSGQLLGVAENWDSAAYGSHLSGRRKTNTSREHELRKAVHAAGNRFRLYPQIAKGSIPGIVLPGRRVAA